MGEGGVGGKRKGWGGGWEVRGVGGEREGWEGRGRGEEGR